MLIDLHCHTLKCKKGDGILREPTLDLFKSKVIEAGVEILAITNHNYFDIGQYLKFKSSVEDNCDVWPGIELDVCENGNKPGHVLIIVDPSKVEEFDAIVNEHINFKNPDKFSITVTDMCNLFNGLEVVYIPHFFKTNEIAKEDMCLLLEKAYSKKRVLHEPADIRSIGVLNSNGYKGILGSDVKDWNNYEKSTFANTKYDFKNYSNFVKLLDKDTSFISDLLDKNIYEEIKVYGDSKKLKYPFEIKIYNDVNIIFGDKGSGKTEILDSLKNYFKKNKGIIPIEYNGGDKSKWYETLIKEEPSKYSCDDISIESRDDEFKNICDFVDTNPVNISEYISYFKYASKNKKRKVLKVLNLDKFHTYDMDIYNKIKIDYLKLVKFYKDFKQFELYDKNNPIYKNVENDLITLEADMFKSSLDEWINQKSIYLTDDAIEKLNSYVSESDGTPVMPKEVGFYKFAKNRLKLLDDVYKVNESINICPTVISNEYIGKIGEKGDGYLENILGFVNESCIDTIDAKKMRGQKKNIKPILSILKKLPEKVFDLNLMDLIANLSDYFENDNMKSLNYFIFNEKMFKLNGKEYKPSKGEIAILSLQYELLNKNTEKVFIIDEPEVNLGSVYIEKTIVPLIKSLGKAKKVVVIATHDANIAVRTYPCNSILKIMENDVYKTYQGSMFTNELVNILDNTDILSWSEESEKYLEGGDDAFAERGDIYG